jgi:hypothetical protein
MKNNIRFADTGVALYELTTHFVVHCPKCDGKALVKSKAEGQKLVCTKCFHVEEPHQHFYGRHSPIRRDADWDGKWKKLKTECDNCGDVCEYEAKIQHHYLHNGRMTDPVFGLPLWLQTTYKNDILWAYHYEHLAILEGFIGAKLRERGIEPRNTIKKNSSMISRLPAFISKAGNREDLLKLIHELRLT